MLQYLLARVNMRVASTFLAREFPKVMGLLLIAQVSAQRVSATGHIYAPSEPAWHGHRHESPTPKRCSHADAAQQGCCSLLRIMQQHGHRPGFCSLCPLLSFWHLSLTHALPLQGPDSVGGSPCAASTSASPGTIKQETTLFVKIEVSNMWRMICLADLSWD